MRPRWTRLSPRECSAKASGFPEPLLPSIPTMRVRLLNDPGPIPAHRVGRNTGTNFNFDIHPTTVDPDETLTEGTRTFLYEAEIPTGTSPTELAVSLAV